MTESRHEIVVVGGGIAGAATALAFARGGFDVSLVERAPRPPATPGPKLDARVYAIAPSSERWLRRLGAWPVREAEVCCAYERMRVWSADPSQALVFDAAEAALPKLGQIVAHDELLHAVWSRLGAVRCRLGAAVEGFEAAASGPCLRLADGQRIGAELVVAADGAQSPLRALAGIDTVGWHYAQQAIVCHLQTEQPHAGTAYQRFLPEGPLALLPLADGRSSLVWSSKRAAERMTLADADFARELHRWSQDCLGLIGRMTARQAVPLRLQHARDYVRAGLALVGDAAHVVHPLAGQGLNLGLADAEALVRVVEQARRERRPPGAERVLRRYARQRKVANLEMLALTEGLYRLFGFKGPGLDALRGLGLSLVDRLPMVKESLLRRAVGS